MSDSKNSSPPENFVRRTDDGVVIAIKAQPRAGRTEVVGLIGGELKIKIAAPPVDSAANEVLLEFLARTLGCPRRAVVLLRGASSRHKQVAIHGFTPEQVVAVLTSLPNRSANPP